MPHSSLEGLQQQLPALHCVLLHNNTIWMDEQTELALNSSDIQSMACVMPCGCSTRRRLSPKVVVFRTCCRCRGQEWSPSSTGICSFSEGWLGLSMGEYAAVLQQAWGCSPMSVPACCMHVPTLGGMLVGG